MQSTGPEIGWLGHSWAGQHFHWISQSVCQGHCVVCGSWQFGCSWSCRLCAVCPRTLCLQITECCCTADHIQANKIVQRENVTNFSVMGEFALSKALQHFHPITGFPPDILYNLFECIVPVELPLCIHELSHLFTLEYLNTKIHTFP